MGRYRRTPGEYDDLLKEKRLCEQAIEYADAVSNYGGSPLWKAIERALKDKIEQYAKLKDQIIDSHRDKLTPELFEIEVTIARRSQMICQQLLDMPRNMMDFRKTAEKNLESLNERLGVKPGQVYRYPSASSRQKN